MLTILAIGFATAVLVFFVSLQLSSYATSIGATVQLFQGHLQVQVKGYLDKPQLRKAIVDGAELRKKIEKVPNVRSVALRASGFALLSSSERSYGVSIVGVEPEHEPSVSSIPSVVRQGQYFNADQQILLGSYLARNLKVQVGDELTLLGQGYDGSLAAGVLVVVGIFETGSNELDRNMVQIPLHTFQTLFSMNDLVHALTLRLTELEAVSQVEQNVAHLLGSDALDVLRWDEIVPGLKEAIELDMASGWLFYFSLILIVSFSVLNTFWMAVLERTREFAILLALGTKPGSIVYLVLLECAFLTFLGVLIGLVLGSACISYFGVYGFSVPGSEEIVKKWNVPAIVYTRFSWQALSSGPIVLWSIAVLAVVYPALQIFRLQPVQALSGRKM